MPRRTPLDQPALKPGQRPQDQPKPLAPRFWAKVDKSDVDGCWIWTAGKDGKGYGRVGFEARTKAAHHAAWFLEHGYWPTYIEHVCDNPPCVRVDHLREGSPATNSADMANKGRHWRFGQTHCKNGHPWDYANTDGVRRCSVCRKEVLLRWSEKRRQRNMQARAAL